ncbi:MAG: lasso RiPP family leader peptide-containing protein [Anaerolineales bacterium]|nr:lasso RiPP family leader peptide-containing protein [Anaerolineales bacterium]
MEKMKLVAEQPEQVKKAYHAPALVEFGDLAAITQQGTTGNFDLKSSHSFN